MTKLNVSEVQIAWLAGLFEGEAYFSLDKRPSKRYQNSTASPAPFIKISMVDEDIIARVASLLNKKYFSPSRLTVTNKKVYVCHIGDRQTLIYLFPKILPYMGKRRKEILETCIKELQNWEKWKIENSKSTQADKD